MAMAIQAFAGPHARAIFEGKHPGKGFPVDLVRITKRKLEMPHAAVSLESLRAPPGNRLEALAGGRKGQHSIRVNGQFRLCFVWTEAGPAQVEFVDYH